MNGLLSLRWVRNRIGELVVRAPEMRFGGNSSGDWLPPSLGPSDWSHGMMESMADRSASWYFDRH